MKIIESIHIDKFRAFEDVTIKFNKPVNAIIGRNGTLKTTLLGMLAQPFSLETGDMSTEEPLIGGKKFNSQMSDKFKFSEKYDVPGEHKWSLTINQEVYEKGVYTCVSERRKDNNRLRFWSTEGRSKGMNYIQCPVIYLSMKRLLPIGEEKQLQVTSSQLTDEEKTLYIEWHNQILISTESILDVSTIQSHDKYSLGPETEVSDAWTISAGQDNIGRIILAVLSMKRLMDKYNNEYKGGIIFIDEVESTLYPAAQEKLLEFMFKSAVKYKLQFFFTTHSISAIRYLKLGEFRERATIAYLQKIGGKINIIQDPSLLNIENDLNVAAGKRGSSVKIKIYCEDNEGRLFCSALLTKELRKYVEFVPKIDLSWTIYKTLYVNKVPEFLNNIIVLDGDARKPDTGWKNYPKNTNILFLPSDMAPEQCLYEMLFYLDEKDPFWDNELSGYSKTVCFRDYTNHLSGENSIDSIKKWFKEQKDYAGPAYRRFFNLWKKKNSLLVEEFQKDFIKKYNYVAKRVGSPTIEDN